MWNFIMGFLKTERPLASTLLLIWKTAIAMVVISILWSMGIVGLIAALFIATPILNKLEKRIEKGKEIDTVPYWGRIFGLRQTIKLLSADKLKPYKLKDGTFCHKLMITESGRWFFVNGRFYPTNLILRFEPTTNKLVMINGDHIKEQYWLDDEEVRKALNEILYAKKAFYDHEHRNSAIADCQKAFKNVWKKDLTDLSKADWDDLRYRWEQELADIEASKTERSNYNQHMSDFESAKVANKELHGRVLLDVELETIARSIENGKIKDIKDWFDKSLFRNDICVLNGVKLLKRLGHPKNASAMDFLFDCITDIQKPYFEEAVNTLEMFPNDLIIPQIEKYVEQAHAQGDVLFGAGLLYLSKRIGYEISLKRADSTEVELQESESEFEKLVMAQGKM